MREFWLAALVATVVGGDPSLPPMPRVDSVSREALLFESVSPVFAMLDSTDPALRSDFQESEATPEGLLFDDVVGVIPIPAPRTSGR